MLINVDINTCNKNLKSKIMKKTVKWRRKSRGKSAVSPEFKKKLNKMEKHVWPLRLINWKLKIFYL